MDKNIIKVAHLIDDYNSVIAIFEVNEMSEYSITGVIKHPYSWNCDGTPSESHYFAKAYIKSGGCSHFWYYGEDASGNDEDTENPYYHICGVESYVTYMASMAFAFEVSKALLPDNPNSTQQDYYIKKRERLLKFLEGYKIVHRDL